MKLSRRTLFVAKNRVTFIGLGTAVPTPDTLIDMNFKMRFMLLTTITWLRLFCCPVLFVLVAAASSGEVVGQESSPPNASPLAKLGRVIERYTAAPADVDPADHVRQLQEDAATTGKADWGYWGTDPQRYSSWTNHSNRLIPVYVFGGTLQPIRSEGSVYASEEKLTKLFASLPPGTLNPDADYLDQTDVYQLQRKAIEAGKKNIILFVFDGMDWQTTQAAATYVTGEVKYDEGRGTGLLFQDYDGAVTDYGYFVSSPFRDKAKIDVDTQQVNDPEAKAEGGYDPRLGGDKPWQPARSRDYLIGLDRAAPHTVTDSASSATSMTAGIKTYNAAINVASDGSQVEPLGRVFQRQGMKIGVVSSVPVSHATPAAAYANNVTRNDYQDLTRDMIGLPSVAHPDTPLPGVDVLLGAGWGEDKAEDKGQGRNYQPGNRYLADQDLAAIDVLKGGKYVVAQRTTGIGGADVLSAAVTTAKAGGHRLFGFFGVFGGHLPYRTADGNYNAAIDVTGREVLKPEDIEENPTLAQMTSAALEMLEGNEHGFWLMVEPGDVDWANHANNIDNSIGAVLSGDAAFAAVVRWVEANDAWDETLVIVTADHGHYLQLTDPTVLNKAVDEVTTQSVQDGDNQ